MRESVGAWKWEEIQPKEKGKLRGSKKKNKLWFAMFSLFSYHPYYLLFPVTEKMMNYFCTISGVSMNSQDIYNKVFAIGNYNIYVLINGILTKCDCNK